ncbi:MAG: hypothetical protein INH41_21335 [Myxococcaceae bacterium]|nr:hypothetical protein [Myxococcaceae bacterium]MCA3014938.1 hypothetical protein [Myxococcaceae bacterium]
MTAVAGSALVDDSAGSALERADTERRADGFKRQMRFTPPGPGRVVTTQTAADLFDLELPDGGTFACPCWTIEGVTALPGGRVANVNDAPLPFGCGGGADTPDPTERIVVEPR